MSPRTPAFDEDGVIDAAIETFTRLGYEGADASTLCRETGLARSSLYNSFGSRDALFVRALAEYSRRGRAEAGALPDAPGRALALLRSRLLDDVQRQAADGSRDGCLSVNTILELGRSMDEAVTIIDADRAAWVDSYALLLERAASEGDLVPASDLTERAALLHTVLAGLRVAARVLTPAALVAQGDALLGSWATEAGRDLLARLATDSPRAGAPGTTHHEHQEGAA